jgi:hypothetical protein
VSSTIDPQNGFPSWHQDSAGNRVERSCNLTVTVRPTAVPAYSAGLVVGGDLTTVPNTVQDAMTGTGR